MSAVLQHPTFVQEEQLWRRGYCQIAGIDEAGRGALAGPLVAAAVIVPRRSPLASVWAEVRDSKLLSPQRRNTLAGQIQVAALAWGVGAVAAATIDQIGIAAATRQAMLEAIARLHLTPDYLLIDWVRLPQTPIAQESLVKADRDIVSVAAASILAKVHRDQLMVKLHEQYPQYGFAHHKGYGAPAHLSAIVRYGPCLAHRQSFAPLTPNRDTLPDDERR